MRSGRRTVKPAKETLLDLSVDAYRDTLRHLPGFADLAWQTIRVLPAP